MSDKRVVLLATLTILVLVLSLLLLNFLLGFSLKISIFFALVLSAILNFLLFKYSHKLILKMYNAHPMNERIAPELCALTEELSSKLEIPSPELAVVPNTSPNIFSTGCNQENAKCILTDGALGLLSTRELKCVLAHELVHIKNKDTLPYTAIAVFAGAVGYLGFTSKWFLMKRRKTEDMGINYFTQILLNLLYLTFAPIACLLIRFVVSHEREFETDLQASKLCGMPQELASALVKIQNSIESAPFEVGNPATAHLFLVNPFSRELTSNLSCHPSVEERVKRLNEIRHSSE
ncbi:MAG: M48 family metalloprotease [Candidatus Methanofastidiosia archaeon]